MKALLTYEPADVCEMYTENCNVSFISNRIYKPSKDSHRNAPCPCGSGKKYKRCCMNKEKYNG